MHMEQWTTGKHDDTEHCVAPTLRLRANGTKKVCQAEIIKDSVGRDGCSGARGRHKFILACNAINDEHEYPT